MTAAAYPSMAALETVMETSRKKWMYSAQHYLARNTITLLPSNVIDSPTGYGR